MVELWLKITKTGRLALKESCVAIHTKSLPTTAIFPHFCQNLGPKRKDNSPQ